MRRVHVGLIDGDQHWHALHHKGAQRQQVVQNPAAAVGGKVTCIIE